jgi:glycosyltransferase involved in cell wall biosynthesis
LVVAGQGDPEYVASLRDQAEALGISGGIIWVGFISGDAKWALYRLADVFVLPSYSENFAVVVLEAMSCGTPVLLTENVALAEEFRPHSAAIVVQATVNSVAQGLCSLLADPGFAERLGEHGREIALANFSEEACISKMLALYEHVIKTRGSGRSAPTATVKNPESQKQTLTP